MSTAACEPTQLGTMLTFAARVLPSPEPEVGRGATEPKGRDVHSQLWQACAGSMCAVPPVGAVVYYFPQGHAEQAGAAVDLRATGVHVLLFVACRVAAVRLMAEPDTDDMYTKTRLVPLHPWEPVADVGDALAEESRGGDGDGQQQRPRPLSFAKTLTQSDVNTGGGFSVPRLCALSIFPELDYSFDPPLQIISATDVHGVEWTFRHIYRGSPHRHLLTTGSSNFVHSKELLPGDSVVFVREEDGKVHVGLRRAKSVFCDGDGNAGSTGAVVACPSGGKVPAEDVVEAARLAAAGQPFEVVHYPRASAPEFCVRADAVKESMRGPWCLGLRFKMAFEAEDLSWISWFMGTIARVEPADPERWPQSPWRLLQVTWDEPELLQNVNRVCPWWVQLVSSMPNLPRFSPPPRKKPRTPAYTETLSERQQLFDPDFPFPPTHPLPQFAPFFSDLHLSEDLQQNLLFCGIRPADHQAPPVPRIATDLKIGSPTPRSPSPEAKKGDDVKPPGNISNLDSLTL